MRFESENTEFKVRLSDEIYKEMVAFANTDGGVIYLGVTDQGETVGLEDVDETLYSAYQWDPGCHTAGCDHVCALSAARGPGDPHRGGRGQFKPYYLKSKGLKPNGVYVRQGASSAPASTDLIRQMIKESDGDQFEDMRTMQQDLTVEEAEQAFARYGVAFSEEKFITLGLRNLYDDHYTNLALLLSDQCSTP